MTVTLLQRFPPQLFFCEFWEFFQSSFSLEYLQKDASKRSDYCWVSKSTVKSRLEQPNA